MTPLPHRLWRTAAVSALAAFSVLTASGEARAQSEPSARPEVTVPLPNGAGVLYYRAGEPGGVRIRRSPARPDSAAPPAPTGLDPDLLARVLRDALADLRAPEASGVSGLSDGATRADVARLERAVERIGARLDDLAALTLLASARATGAIPRPTRSSSPWRPPRQRLGRSRSLWRPRPCARQRPSLRFRASPSRSAPWLWRK